MSSRAFNPRPLSERAPWLTPNGPRVRVETSQAAERRAAGRFGQTYRPARPVHNEYREPTIFDVARGELADHYAAVREYNKALPLHPLVPLADSGPAARLLGVARVARMFRRRSS